MPVARLSVRNQLKQLANKEGRDHGKTRRLRRDEKSDFKWRDGWGVPGRLESWASRAF